MKVELLSYSDSSGGAARAAFRMHRVLIASGEECTLRVVEKDSDDWRVIVSNPVEGSRVQSRLKRLSDRLISYQKTENLTLHSAAAFFTSGLDAVLNRSDSAVVNLHWVCGNMLSVEEIGRIQKPVVWTMHDMWPFCGAEHYAPDTSFARFEAGYNRLNRPSGDSGLDIDRWVWKRKLKAWRKPMHIISPSRWLAECAKRSVLMRDWPISVVPNPIDILVYKPYPKVFSRKVLNLPEYKRLIAFGAMDGGRDPRKGFDMLLEALQLLSAINKDIACVVFGQSEPKEAPEIGVPIYWAGHLHDDASLALLYSSVDVMVVPSRQENLPQTGTEAQACGCPVVGFDCTGMPDVVEHRITGYLAEAFSVDDLSAGIGWVLEDEDRHLSLSEAARERAVSLWAPEIVVPQYIGIYNDALNNGRC